MAPTPKTRSDRQLRWAELGFQIQQARGLELDRLVRTWGLRRGHGESDAMLQLRALRLLSMFGAPPPPRRETLASLALSVLLFVAAVLAIAALAGCARTPEARLAVYDERNAEDGTQGPAEPLPELPPEVEAACELLPIACEASEFRQVGIVQVHLLPDGMRRGRQIGGRPCWRAVMARGSDPAAIAHELGHAFGLDHREGGLMDRNGCDLEPGMAYSDVLSEDEIERVLRNAGALEACSP